MWAFLQAKCFPAVKSILLSPQRILDHNVTADTTKASFLNYQIRSVNLEIERVLPSLLRDTGCDLNEFYILRAHWAKGTLSFAEISAHADLTDETTKAAIYSLIEKGYVADLKSSGIDPLLSYKLTGSGLKIRQLLMTKYTEFISKLYAEVPEQDIEYALGIMMKIHSSLHAHYIDNNENKQNHENNTVTSIF